METAPIGVMDYSDIENITDLVLKNQLNVNQIATCLSRICRYAGRGSRFYSVAQHSVIVSHMVQPKNALQALMHDITEAYIGDIVGTFKRELKPIVTEKEQELEFLLFESHGIEFPICNEVDYADKTICKAEMFALEHDLPIMGIWAFLDMDSARAAFIQRYHDIKGVM